LSHDSMLQVAKGILNVESWPSRWNGHHAAQHAARRDRNGDAAETVTMMDASPIASDTPHHPTTAATTKELRSPRSGRTVPSSQAQRPGDSSDEESDDGGIDDSVVPEGSATSLHDMRAALQAIEDEIRRRQGPRGSAPGDRESPPRQQQARSEPPARASTVSKRAQHSDPLLSVLGDDEMQLLAQLEASLEARGARWSPPRPLESVAMS
jgi:hypothetical protein